MVFRAIVVSEELRTGLPEPVAEAILEAAPSARRLTDGRVLLAWADLAALEALATAGGASGSILALSVPLLIEGVQVMADDADYCTSQPPVPSEALWRL